jgi:hypothetical protein
VTARGVAQLICPAARADRLGDYPRFGQMLLNGGELDGAHPQPADRAADDSNHREQVQDIVDGAMTR